MLYLARYLHDSSNMKFTNSDATSPATTIEPLMVLLNGIAPQREAVIQYLKQQHSIVFFKSGHMLLEEGTVCEHIYFIKSGVIRGFIKEGKKEITTWISSDKELVTSITSFDLSIPALENIQVIENCELLAFPGNTINELYELFPEFNLTGRKILQQYYRDAEMRAYIIRLSNAENKYKYFLKNYNHLANRVQLQYIASFLGISLETLSRVRKKMSVKAPGYK